MVRGGVVLSNGALHAAAVAILDTAGYDLVVAADEPALRREILNADALIVRNKLPDDILDNARRLRGVVRHGVGLDFIPMQRAGALTIPVAFIPGGNSQSVAEYVFAAIFALCRKIGAADAALRHGDWWTARASSEQAAELHGKTLGVVGIGNVGSRVAAIGAHGFGMQVAGADPQRKALPSFVRTTTIEELFAISDFVVLCCPLTPQTERLVSMALLMKMKPTAILINAARGQLVEDSALVAVLREKRIRGAVLDVFWQQPIQSDHPFLRLDNVLLTPHFAALTADSMERIGRIACEEALRLLRGQRPLHLANPEVWEAAQSRWKRPDTLL